MKKVNFRVLMMLMGVLAISVMTSCNKKDDPTPNPQEKSAKHLIVTTVKNADGTSGSSYMQMVPDFSGSIDNSNATSVNFGAGIGVRGNSIYAFPVFGKDGDQYLTKYTYTGTTNLGTPVKVALTPNSGAGNITVVSDEKVYLPAFNLGKVLIVNPQTMKQTGTIDLGQYAHSDNNPDPSVGIIRDGLYYLCLDQVNASWMPYEDHRQVDVAIIDPKTDKVQKVISETTSKLSFPTRPMDATKGMIFTDEQDDIYIACAGNFGFNPTYLSNGFVCIPSGKQEFDPAKAWDVSNTTIEGTLYKPASIYNCLYVGSGKVVAYVAIMELLDTSNPYTCRNSMAVLMDMNTKTIKQIEDIPLTDGHSVAINEYKDLVMIGSYGKDKVGFFSYNPQTEAVEHLLTTTGNPAYFHYFE